MKLVYSIKKCGLRRKAKHIYIYMRFIAGISIRLVSWQETKKKKRGVIEN